MGKLGRVNVLKNAGRHQQNRHDHSSAASSENRRDHSAKDAEESNQREESQLTLKSTRVSEAPPADAHRGSTKTTAGQWWLWRFVESRLIVAVVVALVGYSLNYSVSHKLEETKIAVEKAEAEVTAAIEKERNTISGATEMQQVFLQLANPKKDDVGAAEIPNRAVMLAAFGRQSIIPLVSLVDSSPGQIGTAAMNGLRIVGLSDKSSVCDVMRQILMNRTGLYAWWTHQSALVLWGQFRCEGAQEQGILKDYATMLDSVRVRIIDGKKPPYFRILPSIEHLQELNGALLQARQDLQRE
jgi:hypothetical protein